MRAFLEAAKAETIEPIDEVYFACSLTAPMIVFPFKWGEVLMPEPGNLDRQRFHAAEERVLAPHLEKERPFEEAYAYAGGGQAINESWTLPIAGPKW